MMILYREKGIEDKKACFEKLNYFLFFPKIIVKVDEQNKYLMAEFGKPNGFFLLL